MEAGSAPKALRPVRKCDNPASLNDSVCIKHWLDHSQGTHSAEVSGNSATSGFVHEKHICAQMPSASAVALKEFDSKCRKASLLAALAGMGRQHLCFLIANHLSFTSNSSLIPFCKHIMFVTTLSSNDCCG